MSNREQRNKKDRERFWQKKWLKDRKRADIEHWTGVQKNLSRSPITTDDFQVLKGWWNQYGFQGQPLDKLIGKGGVITIARSDGKGRAIKFI